MTEAAFNVGKAYTGGDAVRPVNQKDARKSVSPAVWHDPCIHDCVHMVPLGADERFSGRALRPKPFPGRLSAPPFHSAIRFRRHGRVGSARGIDTKDQAVLLFRGQESHPRSVVKAITWRVLGSIDTFVLSLIVTGNIGAAGAIASIETVTKIFLYYGHERLWSRIRWGIPASATEAEEALVTDQPVPSRGRASPDAAPITEPARLSA